MATLRRSHAPVPLGARVETRVWKRSLSGKPRRRRLDRPALTHDPGWDWDGTRVLFSERSVVPDEEEYSCEFRTQLREDVQHPMLVGRAHATLSLLDIARCQVTKRCRKTRSCLDDFEVIRIRNVVPIAEAEPDPGDSWGLNEWEELDASGFKRTYSEVARGFVDKDPCARLDLSHAEDSSWECL